VERDGDFQAVARAARDIDGTRQQFAIVAFQNEMPTHPARQRSQESFQL